MLDKKILLLRFSCYDNRIRSITIDYIIRKYKENQSSLLIKYRHELLKVLASLLSINHYRFHPSITFYKYFNNTDRGVVVSSAHF